MTDAQRELDELAAMTKFDLDLKPDGDHCWSEKFDRHIFKVVKISENEEPIQFYEWQVCKDGDCVFRGEQDFTSAAKAKDHGIWTLNLIHNLMNEEVNKGAWFWHKFRRQAAVGFLRPLKMGGVVMECFNVDGPQWSFLMRQNMHGDEIMKSGGVFMGVKSVKKYVRLLLFNLNMSIINHVGNTNLPHLSR